MTATMREPALHGGSSYRSERGTGACPPSAWGHRMGSRVRLRHRPPRALLNLSSRTEDGCRRGRGLLFELFCSNEEGVVRWGNGKEVVSLFSRIVHLAGCRGRNTQSHANEKTCVVTARDPRQVSPRRAAAHGIPSRGVSCTSPRACHSPCGAVAIIYHKWELSYIVQAKE
jgi:hypothetical protein